MRVLSLPCTEGDARMRSGARLIRTPMVSRRQLPASARVMAALAASSSSLAMVPGGQSRSGITRPPTFLLA